MIHLEARKNRIVYFIFLIILSVLFTIYYYGIQMGVVPSHEELYSLVNGWLTLNKGLDWPSAAEGIYARVCVLIVFFGGVRYGSMRIVWSIFYFLISLVTLDLAMRDNRWNCRIAALPIYILLMVLMHLSGPYLSRYYGKFFYVKDQYPFNFHMGTILAVLLLMWFVYRVTETNLPKRVKYFMYLFVIVGCYFISGTADVVIFLAAGIFPLVAIVLRPYILGEKNRRILCILIVLMLAVVVNFVVDFNDDRVSIFLYKYHLYSFISIEQLWSNIAYYIADMSGTFNFDIWSRTFEPGMIVEFVRIIFLAYIYMIVAKNLRQYFKKDVSIDVMEQVVSWTFLIISMGFIFTTLGSWDKARYFNIFLPYGTIVLCKNNEKFMRFLRISSGKGFVAVGLLLILLSYNTAWGHFREYNAYDVDLRDINILIDEKGLHDGLGTGKIFPSVTAQGRGKNWVYPAAYDQENNVFFLEKELDYTNCFFDYFIVDREDETVLINDSGSFLIEDIIKIYGQPNERIVLNCYELWIYREGIEIS